MIIFYVMIKYRSGGLCNCKMVKQVKKETIKNI